MKRLAVTLLLIREIKHQYETPAKNKNKDALVSTNQNEIFRTIYPSVLSELALTESEPLHR